MRFVKKLFHLVSGGRECMAVCMHRSECCLDNVVCTVCSLYV